MQHWQKGWQIGGDKLTFLVQSHALNTSSTISYITFGISYIGTTTKAYERQNALLEPHNTACCGMQSLLSTQRWKQGHFGRS